MPPRKDEAVTSRPLWIAWIMSQVASPDGERHRGGSHGKPRMTRVGLLDSVRRKEAEGVDGAKLKVVCHVVTRFYEIHHFTIGLHCHPQVK